MATALIDIEFIRSFVMPGLDVTIERCRCMWELGRECIALELSGPDVPDCERVHIVMTQRVDDTHPALVRTATLKPAD